MKILILGGGDSAEREVSLRSAKSVAEACRQAGFNVSEADPKEGLGFLKHLDQKTLIFPILHGKNGEDGILQAELENRQLCFLGSDSKASSLCFDKWKTRQILKKAGLPMPAATLVTKVTYKTQPLAKKPHVLKILHGGSSIGTLVVQNPLHLTSEQIDDIFGMEDEAVLEELIEGSEVTVPILDQKALPVIEIIPPKNEEFDYKNKYNGRTQEICPPQTVSKDMQKKAQSLAEKVHCVMQCRDLSRVDIMIDKTGRLFVLEINTMPGMTPASLYPKSAAAVGFTMPELVIFFAKLTKHNYGL